MNKHTLKVLEYGKVRSIVAAYAASEAGRALISDLEPSADRETVAGLLRETAEFTTILERGETPPLDGIPDTAQAVSKLAVSNSMLLPVELLNTAMALAAARRVKKFFQQFEGKGADGRHPAPVLAARAGEIHPLPEIERAVFSAVDERGEVRDSASPELRKIRRQLVRVREEILERMNRMLQENRTQKVVQEPVITVREDRYVLPLKPNFRQSLPGIVHGQSGSRATLFVEPLEVLESNNRLAELRMEEQEEIERILRGLTQRLAREFDTVSRTLDALASIDGVHARARFGLDYDCVVPALSEQNVIRLHGARHPLLLAKLETRAERGKIVPNDITLADGEHTLILSGPNAGGKTVLLKTAGLLCLMAQSGLPVPGNPGSEVPCFRSVFADIGDEQSLEQDLSTFSSHVQRIAGIVRDADRDCLVLLDELGSGTEPGEGAALGAAVLECLTERGCVTIVTTHHNALKLFGSETTGAVNAALEFDPLTLKPTYRVVAGRPGRSYGLDMAARMGVPSEIIDRARKRLGEDEVRLEKLLEQVEADSRQAAAEREALSTELGAARKVRSEAEKALDTAREEARQIKTRARTEAKDVLTGLRAKLRELSRLSRLEQRDAERERAEVESLGKKLEAEEARPSAVRVGTREFKPGDTVRIESLDKAGRVLAVHRDRLEIEVAAKKITVPVEDVTPGEAAGRRAHVSGAHGWNAELVDDEATVNRLNIIGLRVLEALSEVDRFIDRAGLHHLSVVTVIHGFGTGALKTAVTGFLRDHPLVASIRPGEGAEGGAGVTVVELKK